MKQRGKLKTRTSPKWRPEILEHLVKLPGRLGPILKLSAIKPNSLPIELASDDISEYIRFIIGVFAITGTIVSNEEPSIGDFEK